MMNEDTIVAIDAALVRRYEQRRLLKIAEVARLLAVSTRTVYRLIDAGELQHTRVASELRVPQSSAIAYIDAHTYGEQASGQ